MTINIYCNYGVLGAEKVNVYTYTAPEATADCYDRIAVEIPEGWELCENECGETLVVDPSGMNWLVQEVLCGSKAPHFRYFNQSGEHYLRLRVVCQQTDD